MLKKPLALTVKEGREIVDIAEKEKNSDGGTYPPVSPRSYKTQKIHSFWRVGKGRVHLF